ncbi:MAG: kelch repeat-containing protein, partial [candidate division NC10 bacterium]
PMPTARGGIAAAAVDGQIYVFGGESPDQTFDNTETYDPETDRWFKLDPMPTARHGLAAAPWDGRIYVIGGGPEPGASRSNVHEVFTPPR